MGNVVDTMRREAKPMNITYRGVTYRYCYTSPESLATWIAWMTAGK